MKLQITPLAIFDLEDIASYIAEDSVKRAATFVAELRAKFKQIAQNPNGYRVREELGAAIRSCAHGRYVIFFEHQQNVITIVRVLHSARELTLIFPNE